MPKIPPKQRIKKTVDTGGGPNGEDLVQFIDTETGLIVKEELLPPDVEVVIPAEDGTLPTLPGKLLTAQEMLRLALKEREENYGRRVRELAQLVLEGCKDVVLTGSHTHPVNIAGPHGVPTEIIKGAVKELRSLGYKARQVHDLDGEIGLVNIHVSWPTKLKVPKRGKAAPPPPPPPEPAKPTKGKKKPRKEAAEEVVDEDQLLFTFPKKAEQ